MLTHFLVKSVYFWIIGFFLAILEIQIEGEHGWAAKLPTWRAKPGSWLDKVFKKLMADKDLTGYHSVLTIFILLFAHWPFVWNGYWNIWDELELMAIWLMFVVIWDYLWFVLNPNLSLRVFGPARVWWHKKWLGKFPADYYTGIFFSLLLLAPAALTFGGDNWYKIPILFVVNIVLTTITTFVYPKAY